MEASTALLAAAVGYLSGSVSFARLMMKIFAPEEELVGMDLDTGAGEPVRIETVGGTAISVKLGARYGCITSLLDMLKVAIPTLAFRFGFPGSPYFLITAAMGPVGHNWPLYHRFKGGRGLSAMYGGLLAIDPVGSLVTALLGMLLGLLAVKDVFVSYAAGVWLMIPWLWFRTHDWAYLLYIVFINAVFLLAMIPELRMMRDRKRRGVEGDFAGAMQATPMGQGINKIAERLRFPKRGK